MGSLCQKLPPEHSYEQQLIQTTRSKKKSANKNNISSCINIQCRCHSEKSGFLNSSKLAIYDRIQYTTYGITTINDGNEYNYCSQQQQQQLVDDPQLELHRIISIGYITNELSHFLNISLPLCIIDLCRKYYFALQPLRRKRVIFTSIVHLSLCIHKIPRFVMDESIFFFKINKNQLNQLVNCNNKNNKPPQTSNSDNLFTFIKDLPPLFIHYLKQKSANNLLLLLDDNTSWPTISKQLASIPDIWYGSCCKKIKYAPLILENAYWNGMLDADYKYDVTSADILQEIQTGALKYSPGMEILWQSNPTLLPMKLFDIRLYQLHTGYNCQYIALNSKQRNINTMAHAVQPLELQLDATYYNGSNIMKTAVPCEADLVVLSVYNSGNDFSEYSRTSYCYDQSYTAQLNELNELNEDYENECGLYNPCDIDRAFLNWLKLFDIDEKNISPLNTINTINTTNTVNHAHEHNNNCKICSVNLHSITPSTTSGCNLCMNYHKFVQN